MDPRWAGRIVPGPAAVLGVLLGGTAALALAGARIDPARFVRSCDSGAAGGLDCAAFAKEGAALARVDPVRLGASHLDARIGRVVVVDAELASSLAPDSLAGIAVPVRVISLGRPPPALDMAPLRRIPGSVQVTVPGATRFDAFGVCTPRGPIILRAEGEAPSLCGTATRPAVHAQLVEMVVAALTGPA